MQLTTPTTPHDFARVRPAQRHEHGVSPGICLVISSCPQRRALLATSASATGWQTERTSEMTTACEAIDSNHVIFTVIDLEPKETPSDFKRLCEQIATNQARDLLLLICGHANDPDEELWARHLGTWVYLAGTQNLLPLTGCFEGAQKATQQLNARLNTRQGHISFHTRPSQISFQHPAGSDGTWLSLPNVPS